LARERLASTTPAPARDVVVAGELWQGTWEEGVCELRRVRPDDDEVLTRLEMPAAAVVSGLEWDGGERFYCGGRGPSGTLCAVKRPR